MTTRRPAAAELTIALIPAVDGSGSGSGSGSSSSAMVLAASSSSSSSSQAQPVRNTYSILQMVHAMFYGAPAIPVLWDGHRAGAEEAGEQVVRGLVRGVVVGTMTSYLRGCGRIPLICPEGLFDLNAALGTERDLPVICGYCNRGFCFGVYDVPWLIPPPGRPYLEAPVPATADLFAAALARPLYGGRALQGPSTAPVALVLVCSNRHHFMVRMGMLGLPHDVPSLMWRRPSSLGVLPAAVVGGAGASSPRQRDATAAPPPGPPASAGANRDFVMPGDEDMVQLSLRYRHDPLALTLGR